MMDAKELINYWGSQRKAAEGLQVTYQAVQHWKNKGVPRGIQFEMEVLTDGTLKADREKRR